MKRVSSVPQNMNMDSDVTKSRALNPFEDLPQGDKVFAQYVWLGGSFTHGGLDMRSKMKTLNKKPTCVADLPKWNYDGSSTEQASGEDSEVVIKPCAMYKDPFRRGDNILVMCDTYTPQGKPLPGNTRFKAKRLFDLGLHEEPWFGIEQEYTLFETDGHTPLGWPKNGFPRMQGPYYCSAGTDCAYGRIIADAHAKACVYAGINISGTNAEVMPGQWEYQVGPCTGISSGDETWMSRYLMIRVCEHFGVNVSFEPKPIPGDWNGAGCHTNYSTKEMREPGGFKVIIESVERLAPAHMKHIAAYGKDNELRLTGKHETCAIDEFKYGVANRGASVRIPNETKNQGYGYFEDRRPASNMDPYIVTSLLFETSTLGKPEYDGKRELVEPKSPGSRSNGASRKLEKQSSTTGFRSPRAELGGVKPGYPKA